MEQWTRRNPMTIQGIPESTPGSLDDKPLELFNTRLKITPPIAKEEIEVAHRLLRGILRPQNNSDAVATENKRENATPPPPRVIIKFVSRRTKEVVMGGKSTLKDIEEDNKLPIYFQDDLTATQAELSYKVRQLKHQKKIIETWVINSKVMIKTGETEFIMWNVSMTWTCLETENFLRHKMRLHHPLINGFLLMMILSKTTTFKCLIIQFKLSISHVNQSQVLSVFMYRIKRMANHAFAFP